jgi:hypothetical protein
MDYKKIIKKIFKKKITLEELKKIEIKVNFKFNHTITCDIDRFIKEYQHCINNNEENIIKLFNALVEMGFEFKSEHFSHHLEHGLYDEVTKWYLELDDKFRDNKYLLDAIYGIQGARCYGNPLRCLLSNDFNPNLVEAMDYFWYQYNFDGGCHESCYKCYELLLEHGYKFSNPLVICDILSDLSLLINRYAPLRSSYIDIDLDKFINFTEIQKYLKMEYIEIKKEHIQQFVNLGYKENYDLVIKDIVNELGFGKNNFIKWPNIIINIDNYKKNDMNRNHTAIFKYPLIGFNDDFIQNEFIEVDYNNYILNNIMYPK